MFCSIKLWPSTLHLTAKAGKILSVYKQPFKYVILRSKIHTLVKLSNYQFQVQQGNWFFSLERKHKNLIK